MLGLGTPSFIWLAAYFGFWTTPFRHLARDTSVNVCSLGLHALFEKVAFSSEVRIFETIRVMYRSLILHHRGMTDEHQRRAIE